MSLSDPLFVTRVWRSSLRDHKNFDALRDELERSCRAIADEDAAGQAWCEAKAYPGYTSYGSLNDLPWRASVFGALKRLLDKQAKAYAEALHLDLRGGKLKLDSFWINILEPGGMHSGHIHPHCALSGTVYIRTPEGAGALKFEDPRLGLMMAAPSRSLDAPEDSQTFIYLQPEPGTVFLWESWLRHEVTANLADSERISISFNYRRD